MSGPPPLRLLVDVPPDLAVAEATLTAGADFVAVWVEAPGSPRSTGRGATLDFDDLPAFVEAVGGRVVPRFASYRPLLGFDRGLPRPVPWVGVDQLWDEVATILHDAGARVLLRQELDGDGSLDGLVLDPALTLRLGEVLELEVHGTYPDGWRMLLDGVSFTRPADLARLARRVPTLLGVPAGVVGEALRLVPAARGVSLALAGSARGGAHLATLDDVERAATALRAFARSPARREAGADGRTAGERPVVVRAAAWGRALAAWRAWFEPWSASATVLGGEVYLTDEPVGLVASLRELGSEAVVRR